MFPDKFLEHKLSSLRDLVVKLISSSIVCFFSHRLWVLSSQAYFVSTNSSFFRSPPTSPFLFCVCCPFIFFFHAPYTTCISSLFCSSIHMALVSCLFYVLSFFLSHTPHILVVCLASFHQYSRGGRVKTMAPHSPKPPSHLSCRGFSLSLNPSIEVDASHLSPSICLIYSSTPTIWFRRLTHCIILVILQWHIRTTASTDDRHR